MNAITEEKLTQDHENFVQFGLKNDIMKGINEAGFKIPSPIQKKAIPVVLSGCDMIGQAHTGTGKTAAFGIPVLNMLQYRGGVEVLVLTPTRELAGQVSDELFRLGRFAGVKTTTIYGGQSYMQQIKNIRQGAQVAVATPGRLLDMLESGRITSEEFRPSIVILDEADEMLDMGFLEDIQKIFAKLPENRQTLLFSATMPWPIQRLAGKILNSPETVSVTGQVKTNTNIQQHYFVIEERERDNAIIRLIESQEPSKSIIFCRTKKEVDRIDSMLVALGYSARGLHGDMDQPQREVVTKNFRGGKIDILVATDVAARGLDVKDVSHVFNYHIPFDPESYVHRIGRTARAGRTGVAITLVTPLEFKELKRIKQLVGTNITQSKIPTGREIRKAYVSHLLDDIQKQPLHEDADSILEALGEEMDLPQITYKLISYLLEKHTVTGPEEIGIDDQKLKKILNDLKRNEGRNSQGRRRHPGGYRAGKPFKKGKSDFKPRYNKPKHNSGRPAAPSGKE